MIILGISAFYHDSAVALLRDGEILAAAQEERFTRVKHDEEFPRNAISSCLQEAKVKWEEIDAVVFYDKPFLKFERLLETYLAVAPKGFLSFAKAMPVWIKEKLFQKKLLLQELRELYPCFARDKLYFSEHHLSHAASAFFASPFHEAVVLTMDGVGEWTTTSVAIGRGNKLEIVKEIVFPHSLGLLYSAFTYYLGFKVNSGEYKVMGLAPYGKPRFFDTIKKFLIDVKEDGSYRLDQKYFNYCSGLTMTNKLFDALFENAQRKPESDLKQVHMDIAASLQKVVEEVLLRLANALRQEYALPNLCLAGGVALNCVANGKLRESKVYDDIWVQPAAGDAGGALGAALALNYMYFKQERVAANKEPHLGRRSKFYAADAMKGGYLGPEYSQAQIEDELFKAGASFQVVSDAEMFKSTVHALKNNEAVGWFQGRMEFGPRALGNRSILANATARDMQAKLNLKIKYRESFRPFAPSVLIEDAEDWFLIHGKSPYMLFVANVQQNKRLKEKHNLDLEELFGIEKLKQIRSLIPAVTHVDFSARVQTVHAETNPRFHRLLQEFKEQTNCPVLVNTSFNIRGEPIVCTPTDAFRCFMGTDLDLLVIGNAILRKEEQSEKLKNSYQDEFVLD